MIKNNNGRNSQFTKLSFIYFVLTDRSSILGKRPKQAIDKSSRCRFSFSAYRNANTKATKYVTFGFSFSISVFLTFCQQYVFFNILTAIIRRSSDKQFVLRIVKALHTCKKYDIFSHVLNGFSQGQISLCNTAVYVMKTFIQPARPNIGYRAVTKGITSFPLLASTTHSNDRNLRTILELLKPPDKSFASKVINFGVVNVHMKI